MKQILSVFLLVFAAHFTWAAGSPPVETSTLTHPYPKDTPFFNLIMIAHVEKDTAWMESLADWKLAENKTHPLALMAAYHAALHSGNQQACERFSSLLFSLKAQVALDEDYAQFMDLFKLHQHPEFDKLVEELSRAYGDSGKHKIDYGATNWMGNVARAVASKLGQDNQRFIDELNAISESWIETRTKHLLTEIGNDALVAMANRLIQEHEIRGAANH